ncbi:MAG: YbhB/YbcL family Raf kinase inhibitor-like protein [Ilumatobacter sp.]|nr:YbhB/YbcL family Raf kinase inhibitor-like protein [Ilumatobacter sp.]
MGTVMTACLRSSRVAVSSVVVISVMVSTSCGDRTGKTLDPPVFPPPATTTTTSPGPPVTAATLPPEPAPLVLVAPWVDDTVIPERHTCRGEGVPPALSWANAPVGTIELAITVTDLDADDQVLWIVYGIPPVDGGSRDGMPPDGAFEWVNSSGTNGWEPPCPPPGEIHRYRFTVHALNQQLEAADDAPARDVISLIDVLTIDRASTTGSVSGS